MTLGNWLSVGITGGAILVFVMVLVVTEWRATYVGRWLPVPPQPPVHRCRFPKHLRWHSSDQRWLCASCKVIWRLEQATLNGDVLRWVKDVPDLDDLPSEQQEA